MELGKSVRLYDDRLYLKYFISDLIDIVKDPMDYPKEQDPRSFVSQKTSRGPLSDNWLADHWSEVCYLYKNFDVIFITFIFFNSLLQVKGKTQPTARNMSLMCAYKLCRVEFRYWGMQTKLEKFIHDTALRKTMQTAHCQAWVWQDEWFGLTMDDIREIERQTQLALKQKMQAIEEAAANGGMGVTNTAVVGMSGNSSAGEIQPPSSSARSVEIPSTPIVKEPSDEESSDEDDDDEPTTVRTCSSSREEKSKTDFFAKQSPGLYSGGSKNALHSPLGSAHSFDLQVITD